MKDLNKINIALTVSWSNNEKKFALELGQGISAKVFYEIIEAVKSDTDSYCEGVYTLQYDTKEYEVTVLDYQTL